ncbi:hypothetical protein KSP39_PZI020204 [Platanthera zijinensis]|uniref:Uncharacterized protein n=1 Tax=Platanthera zijinensis TaxID=2320716 RepID=A0AAP0AZZ4_9ASPA
MSMLWKHVRKRADGCQEIGADHKREEVGVFEASSEKAESVEGQSGPAVGEGDVVGPGHEEIRDDAIGAEVSEDLNEREAQAGDGVE